MVSVGVGIHLLENCGNISKNSRIKKSWKRRNDENKTNIPSEKNNMNIDQINESFDRDVFINF